MENLVILLLIWLVASLFGVKKNKNGRVDEEAQQLRKQAEEMRRQVEEAFFARAPQPTAEGPVYEQTKMRTEQPVHSHAAHTQQAVVEPSYTMSSAEGITMEGCEDLAGIRIVAKEPEKVATPTRWQNVIKDVPAAIVAAEILRRPAANRAYARRGRI